MQKVVLVSITREPHVILFGKFSQQIVQIQLEAKESKAISDAIAKKQSSVAGGTINKKTGAPMYVMQQQKSSAQLYKEARINKVPYEPVTITPPTKHATGSSPLAQSSLASKLWMPIAALLLVGLTIEVAVVYAKSSDEGKSASESKPQSFPLSSEKFATPHCEMYTKSTSLLIQQAVADMEIRGATTQSK